MTLDSAEARSIGSQWLGQVALGTPVSAVMEESVLCAREDMSVNTLAEMLLNENISGVPVVDELGRPIGVVSTTDLVRHGYGGAPAASVVADIMTPVAFALHEHASLSQAAALMVYEGIDRIPIVSADRRVVGIVSGTDVLRWLAREAGFQLTRPERA